MQKHIIDDFIIIKHTLSGGIIMRIKIDDLNAEKEARERRLAAYADAIQKETLNQTAYIIEQLVSERHKQKLTQQDVSELTGILPSNLARFESGTRIPTLIILQKYAAALGKKIELQLCDDLEDN